MKVLKKNLDKKNRRELYFDLLTQIRYYLKKYPEDGHKLFLDIEKEIDKPKSIHIICPFCETSQYIYERSGKIICDCPEEVQRKYNKGW